MNREKGESENEKGKGFFLSPILPLSDSPALRFSRSPILPLSDSPALRFSRSPILRFVSSTSHCAVNASSIAS